MQAGASLSPWSASVCNSMAAIEALASESGRSFQDIADEAFAHFLKKHRQPVGLKAALKESVGARRKKSKG